MKTKKWNCKIIQISLNFKIVLQFNFFLRHKVSSKWNHQYVFYFAFGVLTGTNLQPNGAPIIMVSVVIDNEVNTANIIGS